MKYPKGSMGEAEQKEGRIIAIVFGVISVLVLALLFVIPSQLRDNVKAAPGWLNFIGGLLVIGSFGTVLYPLVTGADSTNTGKVWAVALGLGIFCAAGFFGYTY